MTKVGNLISLFVGLGFCIVAINVLRDSNELWRSIFALVGLLIFTLLVCINLIRLYK